MFSAYRSLSINEGFDANDLESQKKVFPELQEATIWFNPIWTEFTVEPSTASVMNHKINFLKLALKHNCKLSNYFFLTPQFYSKG